jgi:hypothetical protein
MTKSCIVCRAVASQDILLQYCDACQSAMYCSRACQRKDWKKRHRKICKFLNVGHGDVQVRTGNHKSQSSMVKKEFETAELCLNEDGKQFFKLFQESTFEGSRAAALEMMNIAKRQTKERKKFLYCSTVWTFLFTFPIRRCFHGQTVLFSCCLSSMIQMS